MQAGRATKSQKGKPKGDATQYRSLKCFCNFCPAESFRGGSGAFDIRTEPKDSDESGFSMMYIDDVDINTFED
jgi:hypothetical protein